MEANVGSQESPSGFIFTGRKLRMALAFGLVAGSALLALAVFKSTHSLESTKAFAMLGGMATFLACSWIFLPRDERVELAGQHGFHVEDKAHFQEIHSRFTTQVLTEERSKLVQWAKAEADLHADRSRRLRAAFVEKMQYAFLGAGLMLGCMCLAMGGAMMEAAFQTMTGALGSSEALRLQKDGLDAFEIIQMGFWILGNGAAGIGMFAGFSAMWANRKVGSGDLDQPVATLEDKIALIDGILTQRGA